MRKLNIYIIFIILLSFFTFATTSSAKYIGDGNFYGGTSRISSTDTANYHGRNMNNPSFSPLIADLDGNNVSEIVIIDDKTLQAYNYSTTRRLRKINDIILSTGDRYDISNPVIIDIDDDSKLEVAVFDAISNNVSFYKFETGAFTKLYDVTINISSGYTERASLLQCSEDDNICVIAITFSNQALNPSAVFVFDETQVYSSHTNSENYGHCLPQFLGGELKDIDSDNDLEFVFPYYFMSASVQFTPSFSIFNIDSNNIISLSKTVSRGQIGTGTQSYPYDCAYQQGVTTYDITVMTTPMLIDVDESPSTLEIVIPIASDDDEFKVYTYKPDGSLLDDHPEVLQSNGKIMSPPFLADIFDDTDENDVCVLGYEPDEETMEALCFSENTASVPETNSFFYDIPSNEIFNLTFTARDYSNIGSSIDSVSNLIDGHNPSEILTTYGLFKITDVNILGVGDLEYIFLNDFDSHSHSIPYDYDDNGYSEIITISRTNIWYIEDGFTKSGCGNQNCIREISINPNNEYTWQVNTSLEIRVKVSDVDGDQVSARVYLYYDSIYEQLENWTNYFASGSVFSFTDFNVNQTIGSGTIRIEARDNDEPSSIQVYELPFSVSNQGIVYGDSINNIIIEDITVDPLNETLSDPTSLNQNDNYIKNTLDDLGISGNIGYTATWLLLMILVGVLMMVTIHNNGMRLDKIHMIMIGFIELIMLILGTYLGFLSATLIIIISFISLAGLGLYFKGVFSHA